MDIRFPDLLIFTDEDEDNLKYRFVIFAADAKCKPGHHEIYRSKFVDRYDICLRKLELFEPNKWWSSGLKYIKKTYIEEFRDDKLIKQHKIFIDTFQYKKPTTVHNKTRAIEKSPGKKHV